MGLMSLHWQVHLLCSSLYRDALPVYRSNFCTVLNATSIPAYWQHHDRLQAAVSLLSQWHCCTPAYGVASQIKMLQSQAAGLQVMGRLAA